MNTNHHLNPEQHFNYLIEALQLSYSHIDTAYTTKDRAFLLENLNKELVNLLYFRTWINIGSEVPHQKSETPTPETKSEQTKAGKHTPAAASAAPEASAAIPGALQNLLASQERISCAAWRLTATLTTPPYDAAAVTAAAWNLAEAASVVPEMAAQLNAATTGDNAAAANTPATTAATPQHAAGAHEGANKVQYFYESYISDKKIAA